MADFPVCPSSERTESELPPFCRGAVKPGRFCRKVVSANLFADTLPKSIDCTAQSLRPYGPAPFTQGSLSVYPPACLNCPKNSNLSGSQGKPIRALLLSVYHKQRNFAIPLGTLCFPNRCWVCSGKGQVKCPRFGRRSYTRGGLARQKTSVPFSSRSLFRSPWLFWVPRTSPRFPKGPMLFGAFHSSPRLANSNSRNNPMVSIGSCQSAKEAKAWAFAS